MVSVMAATQQLVDALSSYAGSDTRSNAADLEALKGSLLGRARDLDSAELKQVTLAGSEFGSSDLGFALGDHHGRARRVIVETILGVVEDLNRYHDGVAQAARLLDTADTGSADSMERARIRVEAEAATIIGSATGSSEADNRYDEARNSDANAGRAPGAADDIATESPGGSPAPTEEGL